MPDPLNPQQGGKPEGKAGECNQQRDQHEIRGQERQRAEIDLATGISGCCAWITNTVMPVGGLIRPMVHITVTKMPNQMPS